MLLNVQLDFFLQPYRNPNEDSVDYDSAESAPSSDDEDEEDIIGVRR